MGVGRKERWFNEAKSSPNYFSKAQLDGLGAPSESESKFQRPEAKTPKAQWGTGHVLVSLWVQLSQSGVSQGIHFRLATRGVGF